MLGLRLPSALEKRLQTLADKTHRSKSFYARKAIEEFLDDREDYLLAADSFANFEKSGRKAISLEEMKKRLKIDA